jgi:hypothetical protein
LFSGSKKYSRSATLLVFDLRDLTEPEPALEPASDERSEYTDLSASDLDSQR